MDEIIEVLKEEAGVRIRYRKDREEYRAIFSMKELIDSQINVYHLLQYPAKYRIDVENHRIIRKRHGQ